ncbi:MAG: S26 family signal peptidase [Cloacibacterium normanense]
MPLNYHILELVRFKKPKKNDIVVFNYPGDSVHTAIDRKDPYVKRCVAVGGDVVEMRAREFIHQWQTRSSIGRCRSSAFIHYLYTFRNEHRLFMEKSCLFTDYR